MTRHVRPPWASEALARLRPGGAAHGSVMVSVHTHARGRAARLRDADTSGECVHA